MAQWGVQGYENCVFSVKLQIITLYNLYPGDHLYDIHLQYRFSVNGFFISWLYVYSEREVKLLMWHLQCILFFIWTGIQIFQTCFTKHAHVPK